MLTISELRTILSDEILEPSGGVVILRDTDVIERIQCVHIRSWGSIEISTGKPCRDGKVVGKICYCKVEHE